MDWLRALDASCMACCREALSETLAAEILPAASFRAGPALPIAWTNLLAISDPLSKVGGGVDDSFEAVLVKASPILPYIVAMACCAAFGLLKSSEVIVDFMSFSGDIPLQAVLNQLADWASRPPPPIVVVGPLEAAEPLAALSLAALPPDAVPLAELPLAALPLGALSLAEPPEAALALEALPLGALPEPEPPEAALPPPELPHAASDSAEATAMAVSKARAFIIFTPDR